MTSSSLRRRAARLRSLSGNPSPEFVTRYNEIARKLDARSRPMVVVDLSELTAEVRRLADHFNPPPPDIVDTRYVADRLGCTTQWIADQIRSGQIPKSCLVPGTGNGKPWKVYRSKIERWMETR